VGDSRIQTGAAQSHSALQEVRGTSGSLQPTSSPFVYHCSTYCSRIGHVSHMRSEAKTRGLSHVGALVDNHSGLVGCRYEGSERARHRYAPHIVKLRGFGAAIPNVPASQQRHSLVLRWRRSRSVTQTTRRSGTLAGWADRLQDFPLRLSKIHFTARRLQAILLQTSERQDCILCAMQPVLPFRQGLLVALVYAG
jgi:hypothetical protein